MRVLNCKLTIYRRTNFFFFFKHKRELFSHLSFILRIGISHESFLLLSDHSKIIWKKKICRQHSTHFSHILPFFSFCYLCPLMLQLLHFQYNIPSVFSQNAKIHEIVPKGMSDLYDFRHSKICWEKKDVIKTRHDDFWVFHIHFKRAYRVQHHQISLITISCKCINCVTDKFSKDFSNFFPLPFFSSFLIVLFTLIRVERDLFLFLFSRKSC